jgi:hypothetical protein
MSEYIPEDPEADVDATKFFSPIGDGACLGRPDDYPGFESLAVLITAGGQYKAGKSYRPDPSGARRAVKVNDYSLGWQFLCQTHWIEGLEEVFDILQDISKDPHKFVIRGHLSDEGTDVQRQHLITKEVGYLVKRRSVAKHGLNGHFLNVSRQLQMLDFDGVPLSENMSIVDDPEGCVKWAVDNLLPPEFAEASFIYQLSASAGLTKRDNELNVHLWFFTNREYANVELRTWGKWWNSKQQGKIIDTAVFTEVQPLYTNEPELLEGLIDPLAGRRLGIVRRQRRTVKLYMPTAQEVAAEVRSQRQRGIEQYNRAAKPKAPQKSRKSATVDGIGADSKTLQGQVDEPDDEKDLKPESASGHVGEIDAINLGRGWRGYLMAIGFEGHVRAQIRASIGRYFYEQGSRADRSLLRAEIAKTIEESPFLDANRPGSRARSYAREYLTAPPGGKSNVDEMIADIADRQAKSERQAYEQTEPTWALPKLTADQAFAQIESAIRQTMLDALELEHRRANPLDPLLTFEAPPRVAVNCSTGTGKTEAMIAGITQLLRTDGATRVVIAVPTHKLGEGLADRVNAAYGSKVAGEWYGMDQPDPIAPRGDHVPPCRSSKRAGFVRRRDETPLPPT